MRLTSIEGHCAEKYFEQVFGLFNETGRPEKRKGFKAFDGINNLYNLTYTILKWKVQQALWSAKLESHLGYLHEIARDKPSLVLDFLELYRYLMDNFILNYARNLKSRDFVLKNEDYSTNRKGKRQYLNETKNKDFVNRLNRYFETSITIPRIQRGEHQEIETLISEEALLLARYLRMKNRLGNLESSHCPRASLCERARRERKYYLTLKWNV
jgi:CRISPR-associated endonuclease Cas1